MEGTRKNTEEHLEVRSFCEAKDLRGRGREEGSLGTSCLSSITSHYTPVRFLGWEDPLEKGQADHSSILGLPWWLRS